MSWATGWQRNVISRVSRSTGFRGIPFQSKRQLTVFYKDNQLETHYVPDLFAFNAIVIELKAVAGLNSDHEAQLFNYMRIARQPVGYLINFGHRGELQWKRFIVSDLHGEERKER